MESLNLYEMLAQKCDAVGVGSMQSEIGHERTGMWWHTRVQLGTAFVR